MEVAHYSAPPMPLRAGHDSAIKWMLIVFGVLTLSFFSLIALGLMIGTTGVVGFFEGALFSMLPVPLYLTLWLWIDRFEPEPNWLLATAFFWGAVVAAVFAIFGNTFNEIVVAVASSNAEIATNFTTIISAPIVEETLKGAILLIIVIWRRQDFDGVIDGIVYAGMVGLGFAMTENIIYYGRAAVQGEVVKVLILRGIMSPFLHPWLTSMTGIGFGVARETRNRALKFAAPLTGWMMAIILHMIWNWTATHADASNNPALFFGMYLLFAVPVFIGVGVIIVFSLVREGRMIRRNLKPELDDGTLPLDELRRMGSVTGRLSASTSSLFTGGFEGWHARRKFMTAATTLAFHRDRMEAGTVARDDKAREQELHLRHWILFWRRKLRR